MCDLSMSVYEAGVVDTLRRLIFRKLEKKPGISNSAYAKIAAEDDADVLWKWFDLAGDVKDDGFSGEVCDET